MSQLYTDSESYIPSPNYEIELLFNMHYEPERLHLVANIRQSTLERFLYLLSSVNVYAPEELVVGKDSFFLFGLLPASPTGRHSDYELECEAHAIFSQILQELKIHRGEAAYFIHFNTMMRIPVDRFISVRAGIKRTKITDTALGLAGEKQEYKRMKLPEVKL